MKQKISAFYYIKNNKRRIAVLVISLSLFFIAIYIASFLLSTTSETFHSVLEETTKYVQYIELDSDDLEYDFSDPDKTDIQIYMEAVRGKYDEIAPVIKECEGVLDVYIAEVEYTYIGSIVGNWYVEIPLVTESQMENMLEKMNAKLIDGRFPQSYNEVVLDRGLMKNYGYQIGDSLSQNENVKVVGVIDCEYYFGCGLANEEEAFHNPEICILLDGKISDLRAALKEKGIELEHSKMIDVKNGEVNVKDIENQISNSTSLIQIGFMVIVFILVTIVNISYLRDRQSEWCLYSSIGYGRKTIYCSILREMIFTFISSLFIAVVISLAAMKILDLVVIQNMGLKCTYFMKETLIQILSAFVVLFGLLQIPVRIEIYHIKTIDAIDDDM